MRIAARRQRGFAPLPENGVEAALQRIERLNLERQELRERSAGANVLEENRLAIVHAQWDLSHALIERYVPTPQRTAA